MRFRSLRSQSVLLFCLALGVRLTIAVVQHAWIHGARAEMEREAISLAHTGVLGNPYAVPTGPSAHVNPGYTVVMALIFYLFGTSALGESVKVGLTCLVVSVQYALMPQLGKALRLPTPIAFGAGLFGALVPLSPYVETRGDFENHVNALLLLLLILWTERLSRILWTRKEALALGTFSGISVLTSSILLPLNAIAILYVAYRQTRISGGRPGTAGLSVVMAFVCVMPWAIRNEHELGAPIYTRSNFGLEFFLANNDSASPLMLKNGPLYRCCHPMQNAREAEKVRQLGEVEYNRRLLARAEAWIRAHPERFAELVVERIWYTWMPYTPERIREVLMRLLTLLSFVGLFVIARFRIQSALLLAVPLLVYPLPLYLVQVHLRYRYPIEFILLLTASTAAYAAVTRLGTNQVRLAWDPAPIKCVEANQPHRRRLQQASLKSFFQWFLGGP